MENVKRIIVGGLILDSNNRLLLQKKDSEYYWWPNYWCVFGGGVKTGENLEDCFYREMEEENNLKLYDLEHFHSHSFSETSKDDGNRKREGIIHYFKTKFDGDLSKIRLGEGAGFSIFEKEEIDSLNNQKIIIPYVHDTINLLYKEL
jgi:ADP-ribose pyrophosphatase YjhB (NUDIX family)